ncbi:hypothetical protein O181_028678 [Austropuccinia psidii MF-1]|uniref:Uncharacterized protein n=1 Tax=Austropuccinia psidii MF-1 TaxID=1389203 RepID=A0A9Q3H222_9BASI|nr:hypothetical protein [Austropuccinia psidii MF-1]
MSPVNPTSLGAPRNQPEDRPGLFRTRGSGPWKNGGWKNTQGNNCHAAIHLPIKPEPQTSGLEGYGESSSDPITLQRPILMENGQQKAQPSITLRRTWGRLPVDVSQRDTFERMYGKKQRLESQQ